MSRSRSRRIFHADVGINDGDLADAGEIGVEAPVEGDAALVFSRVMWPTWRTTGSGVIRGAGGQQVELVESLSGEAGEKSWYVRGLHGGDGFPQTGCSPASCKSFARGSVELGFQFFGGLGLDNDAFVFAQGEKSVPVNSG